MVPRALRADIGAWRGSSSVLIDIGRNLKTTMGTVLGRERMGMNNVPEQG